MQSSSFQVQAVEFGLGCLTFSTQCVPFVYVHMTEKWRTLVTVRVEHVQWNWEWFHVESYAMVNMNLQWPRDLLL